MSENNLRVLDDLRPEAQTRQDVPASIMARLAQLEAENAKLKAGRNRKLTMKVGKSGCLSVYGMGRFPVSLYRQQWERLLDNAEDIRAFIEANQDTLTIKE